MRWQRLFDLGLGRLFFNAVLAANAAAAWQNWHRKVIAPLLTPDAGHDIAAVTRATLLGYTLILLLLAAPAVATVFLRLLRTSDLSGLQSWLATSPWRPGLPLPTGPVALTCGDWCHIAIPSAAAAWATGDWRLAVVLVILAMLTHAWRTAKRALTKDRWVRSAAVFAVMPTIWVLIPMLPATAAVLVALAGAATTYALGLIAARQHLVALSLEGPRESRVLPIDRVNWVLGPVFPGLPNVRFWWAAGALAGWWAFSLVGVADVAADGSKPGVPRVMAMAALCLLAGMWSAYARFLAYSSPAWRQPLTLLARLCFGRLIVPRADIVFVAPILALASAFVVPAIVWFAGLGPALAAGFGVATSIWIAALCPPTLRRWILTGGWNLNPHPTREELTRAAAMERAATRSPATAPGR